MQSGAGASDGFPLEVGRSGKSTDRLITEQSPSNVSIYGFNSGFNLPFESRIDYVRVFFLQAPYFFVAFVI